MKEAYEKVQIEIEIFEASDIITESKDPLTQDDDNFGLTVL